MTSSFDEIESFPALTNDFNTDRALNAFSQYEKEENKEVKLRLCRLLGEAAQDLKENINKILPIVQSIYKESDDIKVAFLPQIHAICRVLVEYNNYDQILQKIIPILKNFIQENSTEVREAASEAIIKVTELLNSEDRGNVVLAIVLFLANDNDSEQNRVTAVEILGKLSPIIGQDYCQQFAGVTMISASLDTQFVVRRAVANNFHFISDVVSHQFFKDRLLNVYGQLVKDSVWGVRNTVAQNFHEVIRIAPPECHKLLSEWFDLLIEDQSRWVVFSAYKNLGIVLAYCQHLNLSLVDKFANILEKEGSDYDIIYSTAFNFPGVLFQLKQLDGNTRWNQFSKLYFRLLKDSQVRTRKTLACSLSEVANLIGHEATNADLLPVLESFLKDVEDIRLGVIKSLSKFLEILPEKSRLNYVNSIKQLHLESHTK